MRHNVMKRSNNGRSVFEDFLKKPLQSQDSYKKQVKLGKIWRVNRNKMLEYCFPTFLEFLDRTNNEEQDDPFCPEQKQKERQSILTYPLSIPLGSKSIMTPIAYAPLPMLPPPKPVVPFPKPVELQTTTNSPPPLPTFVLMHEPLKMQRRCYRAERR